MQTTQAENILRVYQSGTLSQIRTGASWYADAHALALHAGKGDVWRGAGVIAAYSPLTPWIRNVELARESLRTNYARRDTLGTSARAAQRILNGEHTLDVLKGDKVRAFAAAIATNGETDIATIDRHAHDIAMGRVFDNNARKIGKRVFREMGESYAIAARELNLSVAQVQAITWVIWREMKGIHHAG